MSTTQSSNASISLVQGMMNAVWPYMSGSRGLIVLAIGIAAGGMAMNWGWLTAVGAAPILLAVLPCAAMCGLGMCMNKARGKSCSSDNKTPTERLDFKKGPDGGA